MKQHRATRFITVILAVLLVPALFGSVAVADSDTGEAATTGQPLLVDGIVDSVLGDDDEDGGDGGVIDSVLGGESFDGYPDGFSEDGIDDFETALGEDSAHYAADSLTYEVEAVNSEGEEIGVTATVSAANERALVTTETPDRTVTRYVEGDTTYLNIDGESRKRQGEFDKERLYSIEELRSELDGVNLTEDTINGNTVVYTGGDERSVELAVRDTGELETLQIRDGDLSATIEFSAYDSTTVEEPAWTEEAETVERPDEPMEDGEELRETAARIRDEIERTEARIERLENGENQERPDVEEVIDELEERIERAQEQIERHKARIDELESGDEEADYRENIEELEETREELAEEQADLRERLNETEDAERVRELRERIDFTNERIDDIERDIERFEDKQAAYDPEEEIAEHEAQIEKLERRISEGRERIEQLETREERVTTDERIERLEERKERMERELERIERRLDE